MFITKPLDASFGVEIHGLDLSRPHTDETLRQLLATFHKHQVIKIPDQEITLDDFARLGEWFGRPQAHVAQEVRGDRFPFVTQLTNTVEEQRNAAAYWHTDNTYEHEGASATMLWAKTVPERGGGTMVADMYAAYESLPDTMQKRIDCMRTLHGWIRREEGFAPGTLPVLSEARQAEMAKVTHPLVIRHPVTGRKALYGVSGSSRGIEGMPPDEGLALLRELTAHATQERFRMCVQYRVNDIAAWDNLATLHSATPHSNPSVEPGMLREMYRISVKGTSRYAQPFTETADA